jgi:hypothetical protein
VPLSYFAGQKAYALSGWLRNTSLVRQSLMWYGFVSDYSFHCTCSNRSSGVMVGRGIIHKGNT